MNSATVSSDPVDYFDVGRSFDKLVPRSDPEADPSCIAHGFPSEADERSGRREKAADESDPLRKYYLLPTDAVLQNFVRKRYLLFSRFDEGIIMNKEMWYSVCPEAYSSYIASKIAGVTDPASQVVLDLFGGAGGQAIAVACQGLIVYSVEYSHLHCEFIRRNSIVYDVGSSVIPVCGDVFSHGVVLARSLRPSCIILSPPWGGPGYNKNKESSFEEMSFGPYSGQKLLELMLSLLPFCTRFVLHIPRTLSLESARSVRSVLADAARRLHGDAVASQFNVLIDDMCSDGFVSFVTLWLGSWPDGLFS